MLSAVERKIEQFVSDLNDKEVSRLYSRLPHGKRLRAKLILKIAGTSLSVVKTAAIVEMIHAASLLHDDVIDDADTAFLNAYAQVTITDPGFSGTSGMCLTRLWRDVSGDDYAADAIVYEFDIHYQRDQPGSRTEFTK